MTESERAKHLERNKIEADLRNIFRDFAENTKQTADDLEYLDDLIVETADYIIKSKEKGSNNE